MSAKEMFEELGYERTEFINANSDYINKNFITYTKDKINICISNFSEEPSVAKFENKIFGYKYKDITLKELKAINKQVEELGWNNE